MKEHFLIFSVCILFNDSFIFAVCHGKGVGALPMEIKQTKGIYSTSLSHVLRLRFQ
jgi:hypothetical protein